MEPAVGGEASDAALAQAVNEATVTERLEAMVELVRTEVEAVARRFRGEIAEAESRVARSLDAYRAELYDALTESFTQVRLEVAGLEQQLRRTEAAVAQLVERQGGEVTPAPVPAPVRPSLLDDLDRQLREAETRLARRLSTPDR